MQGPHGRLSVLFTIGFFGFSPIVLQGWAESSSESANVIVIDASRSVLPPATGYLRMGGGASNGHEVAVNERYLVLDGKPWLPVMGEFHFSRYPEQYWEEEILKMKAGGVQIISTYVFWIHHEEIEGQFDWTGPRDLRHFVELCKRHGMFVFARIGPWVHGEARNGGFPDWLLQKGPTRKNDPIYLSYVRRFYGKIGKQLKGLLWGDGGPIIGIQLENEYGDRGPDAGAVHIAALKKIALECGLNAPLYTVTGWPNPDFPAREVIPAFGGYPDGFWYGSLDELPPNDIYLFNLRRDSGHAGEPYEKFSTPDERLSHYPYFIAEGGGGMETAYHRRPQIGPDDVAAGMLTHIGSGTNLYGYYMFHGGANPEGKLSTLQESSATDYPNDLPVISYDFQAPLGEFGQMRPSFRQLKLFHLFLQDFGEYLAPMVATLPETIPKGPGDSRPPRVAVRANGEHAFLFLNNYVRNYPLPVRKQMQVSIKLPSETIAIPKNPIDVPSQAYFVWPINLDLGGAKLVYATSQLVCRVNGAGETYYFFFAIPGIESEVAFDANTLESINAPNAATSRVDNRVYVRGMRPGTDIAITSHSRSGHTAHIVLLSPEQARDIWKASFAGREYIFLSPADVFFGEDVLHFRARDIRELHFGVFPPLDFPLHSNVLLRKSGHDGLFSEYTAQLRPRVLEIKWERVHDAAPPPPVRMAKTFSWRGNPVAAPPEDFERAGLWRIVLPKRTLDGLSDAFLRIRYTGDAGRLYEGHRLLDDDFYRGTVWEVGLKRFAPSIFHGSVDLKILPLRKDAPIYLPPGSWPDFRFGNAVASVDQIVASPEYEVTVTIRRRPAR